MVSSGNVQASGAIYEAVLIDKITPVVDDIIQSLDKLEKALGQAAKPGADLSNSMQQITNSMRAARQGIQATWGTRMTAILTKARTAVLSLGQGLSQLAATAATAFRTAGLTLIGFAAAMTALIVKFTNASATATEVFNRFTIAFGKNADAMTEWIETLARVTGRSETLLQRMASRFVSVFKIDLGIDQATELSKFLTRLTLDLASFENVSPEEAFQRMISGINGASNALERLNAYTQIGNLKQIMKDIGMDPKQFQSLKEIERQMLRVLAIIKFSKDAAGDLARTKETWANQTFELSARLEKLYVVLGRLLEKALLPFLTNLNRALAGLAELVNLISAQQVKEFIASVAAAAVIGTGFLAIAAGLSVLAGLIITFSTALSGLFAALSFAIAAGPAGWVALILGVVAAIGLVGEAFHAITSINFGNVFNIIREGLAELYATLAIAAKAFADAIATGDIEAAWKVVTITGEIAFLEMFDIVDKAFWEMIDGWFVDLAGRFRSMLFDLRDMLFAFGGGAAGFGAGRWWEEPEVETDRRRAIDDLKEQLKGLAETLKTSREEAGIEPLDLDSIWQSIVDRLTGGGGADGAGPEFKAQGGFASSFAGGVSQFGPDVSESKKQTKLQQEIETNTSETNTLLTRIEQKPELSFG